MEPSASSHAGPFLTMQLRHMMFILLEETIVRRLVRSVFLSLFIIIVVRVASDPMLKDTIIIIYAIHITWIFLALIFLVAISTDPMSIGSKHYKGIFSILEMFLGADLCLTLPFIFTYAVCKWFEPVFTMNDIVCACILCFQVVDTLRHLRFIKQSV